MHLSKTQLKKELRRRAVVARKSDPKWKSKRLEAVPHKQQKVKKEANLEKERVSKHLCKKDLSAAFLSGHVLIPLDSALKLQLQIDTNARGEGETLKEDMNMNQGREPRLTKQGKFAALHTDT